MRKMIQILFEKWKYRRETKEQREARLEAYRQELITAYDEFKHHMSFEPADKNLIEGFKEIDDIIDPWR